MPFSSYAIQEALLSWISGDLVAALQASAPEGNGEDAMYDNLIPLSALSISDWPNVGWGVVPDPGVVRLTNSGGLVDFGSVVASQISVMGIGIYNGSGNLIGWAPLVDASGQQVTRTFSAGDSIRIPIEALSIGVSV